MQHLLDAVSAFLVWDGMPGLEYLYFAGLEMIAFANHHAIGYVFGS